MRAYRTRFVLCVLATLAVAGAATAQGAAEPEASADIRRRLATQFVRSGLMMFRAEPLTLETLECSKSLIRLATELAPDDEQLWRTALSFADFSEDDELRTRALVHLAKLNMYDDHIRLRRLIDRIDQTNTYDERVGLYLRLMDDEWRRVLGPGVSSRLALDLALLYNRRGDVESFAQWLAEAATIDPSNAAAAGMAAGFFRIHVSDPYAEAELLVSLMMADPTDITTQAALAELLLKQGAYASADRMYSLLDATRRAINKPVIPDQLSDWAIARWGAGDTEGALRLIDRIQKDTNAKYQQAIRRQLGLHPTEPIIDEETGEEVMPRAPAPSTAAVVRAAIYNLVPGRAADDGFLAAMQSYDWEQRRQIESGQVDAAAFSRSQLESAFIAAWLGRRGEEVRNVLEAATQNNPLSEDAAARFEGWIALNSGHYEQAIEHLQPQIESTVTARLGYALAVLGRGEKRESASNLLQIVRDQPGSLIGVWCLKTLEATLGQPIPPSETAIQLHRLVASVPRILDRLPGDPTLAYVMKVTPHKLVHDPYEPLLVDIEITNTSPIPLAISRGGPILDRVALVAQVQNSLQTGFARVPVIFVDIDHRLRLESRESMVVTVDLRRTNISEYINQAPVGGSVIRLRAISNCAVIDHQTVVPGLLGTRTDAPEMRINGARIRFSTNTDEEEVELPSIFISRPDRNAAPTDLEWLITTTSRIELMTTETAEDLAAMAMLAHLVRGDLPEGVSKDLRDLFEKSKTTLLKKYESLAPESQAWLLTVVPSSEKLRHMVSIAAKVENRYVRAAILMHHLTGADDSLITPAHWGDDEDIRAIAIGMADWIGRQSQTGAP